MKQEREPGNMAYIYFYSFILLKNFEIKIDWFTNNCLPSYIIRIRASNSM